MRRNWENIRSFPQSWERLNIKVRILHIIVSFSWNCAKIGGSTEKSTRALKGIQSTSITTKHLLRICKCINDNNDNEDTYPPEKNKKQNENIGPRSRTEVSEWWSYWYIENRDKGEIIFAFITVFKDIIDSWNSFNTQTCSCVKVEKNDQGDMEIWG